MFIYLLYFYFRSSFLDGNACWLEGFAKSSSDSLKTTVLFYCRDNCNLSWVFFPQLFSIARCAIKWSLHLQYSFRDTCYCHYFPLLYTIAVMVSICLFCKIAFKTQLRDASWWVKKKSRLVSHFSLTLKSEFNWVNVFLSIFLKQQDNIFVWFVSSKMEDAYNYGTCSTILYLWDVEITLLDKIQ